MTQEPSYRNENPDKQLDLSMFPGLDEESTIVEEYDRLRNMRSA